MKEKRKSSNTCDVSLDELLIPIPSFGYSYSVNKEPFCGSIFSNYHIVYNYIKPRLSAIFIPDILKRQNIITKGQNDLTGEKVFGSPRFKDIDSLILVLLEDAPCKTNEKKIEENSIEYITAVQLTKVFGAGVEIDPINLDEYKEWDINLLYNHIVLSFSKFEVKYKEWHPDIIAKRGTDLCIWFYNMICLYYEKYKEYPSEIKHTIQFCELLYITAIRVLEHAIGFNPTWLD